MIGKNKGKKEKDTVNKTQAENESFVENESDTKVEVEIDNTNKEDEKIELSEEEILANRVAELEDKLLRSAADFDNYKKRVARNYDEMVRSAGDKILNELLDIIDNFERALNADENSSAESYREGIKLIFNQMNELIEKHDIKPIKALGKPFDPNLHEALMQVPSDEYDEGIVALEIGKGYMQNNRVLRYSKVGVSTGKVE